MKEKQKKGETVKEVREEIKGCEKESVKIEGAGIKCRKEG